MRDVRGFPGHDAGVESIDCVVRVIDPTHRAALPALLPTRFTRRFGTLGRPLGPLSTGSRVVTRWRHRLVRRVLRELALQLGHPCPQPFDLSQSQLQTSFQLSNPGHATGLPHRARSVADPHTPRDSKPTQTTAEQLQLETFENLPKLGSHLLRCPIAVAVRASDRGLPSVRSCRTCGICSRPRSRPRTHSRSRDVRTTDAATPPRWSRTPDDPFINKIPP